MSRERITEKDLCNLCRILNEETGNPVEYFNKETSTCNPGNFHIDYAYGGCRLAQTCNSGGGERNITHGYMPKRTTYDAIQQFRCGINFAKNQKTGE